MSMYLIRRISEGLGAWLHFEFCCDRSELFSERYLSVPLGIILSSAGEGDAIAEFKHPVLSKHMNGCGRRPAVDFVVCKDYPTPKIAIETKWVGDSGLSVDSIIWDLIRLSLLHIEYGTTCYFVLGGQRRLLDKLFSSKDFLGHNNSNRLRPILNTTNNHFCSLNLVPADHWRVPLLRDVFKGWPAELSCPQSIVTKRSEPFPVDPPISRYQVYAWEVSYANSKGSFMPAENKYYRPN